MAPNPRRSAIRSLVLAALAAAFAIPAAHAQPYARFAVPDTALARAVAASRADYENAWNALLVAELRATLAKADSAKRLAQLERAVADAEPAALGSRIGLDALALRKKWKKDQLRTRVGAAVAESLATAARAARAYGTADSLFRTALESYRGLKERRREAWVLGSLGANALVARRNSDAVVWYHQALAARRALGDSLLIGNTLNDLGQTHLQLGQPDSARVFLTEAAAIRESQRRWGPLGSTLNFLGLAQASLGEPDAAIASYRRSLELTSTAGDSVRTLVVLANYGVVLVDQGRTGEAIGVMERALALATTANDARRIADTENNLGYLYRTTGEYTRAVEHFDRAIAGFTELGDVSGAALSSSRKGLALVNAGELERARIELQGARALADSAGDPALQSRVLSTQAVAAEGLGDLSGARRLAEQALAAATAAGDSAAVHDAAAMLGFLATTEKRPADVERWMTRAIAAGVGLPLETRLNDLAALATAHQLAGRLDDAEREHREVLEQARAAGLTNQAMWSLVCLGDVEERRGAYDRALARYGEAIAMAETLRTLQRGERGSIALLANRWFMFDATIHLLGKLDRMHPDSGYAARAFEWAERSRARAFLDLIARASKAPDDVAAAAASDTRFGIADAQKLLRTGREALLEYSVGDSSTSLWVIRRDRWKRFTLPPRAALQSRARALRRGLADPAASEAGETQKLQRGLYRQLVAPAEPLLEGVDHLIVAADGPLALIPFEALLALDPSAAGKAPRGALVLERYAVSYTPSASVLATREGAERGAGVVAIGNPDFGAGDSVQAAGGVALAPLPSTAAEIATLRTLTAGKNLVTLEGKDASRARTLALAELPRAALVHIATHGDVSETEPERSGLWLAPDPGQASPSRIEVADVTALQLSAGLVTLSACETGLGRIESGEGVIGLSRAFMGAGARSVMVSLWPVNDRSTADLMSRFYRRALDGKTSRDDALASAKRALLANAETRAPFHWAPFVLIGSSGAR